MPTVGQVQLATRGDFAKLEDSVSVRVDRLCAKIDAHTRIMIWLNVFQTGILLGVILPILLHISVKL